jgi:hypothetical protein
MPQYVYVGGKKGVKETPFLVATSLERAMTELLDVFSVPGHRDDVGYPDAWTCQFLDGEPRHLQWTVTVVDGGTSHDLYVCKFEIDTADAHE